MPPDADDLFDCWISGRAGVARLAKHAQFIDQGTKRSIRTSLKWVAWKSLKMGGLVERRLTAWGSGSVAIT